MRTYTITLFGNKYYEVHAESFMHALKIALEEYRLGQIKSIGCNSSFVVYNHSDLVAHMEVA